VEGIAAGTRLVIPAFIKRHWIVTTLIVVVVLPVIGFTMWTESALHYTYSSGTRAGYLQKISRKGWICKTWEGEIQLIAIPGSAPEKFIFSTRSDSIAEVLTKLNGEKVVVDYQQHKGVPLSCFGETEYFVVGARVATQ
jgi:hypothetical protein